MNQQSKDYTHSTSNRRLIVFNRIYVCRPIILDSHQSLMATPFKSRPQSGLLYNGLLKGVKSKPKDEHYQVYNNSTQAKN